MGTHFKKSIFDEHIQVGLVGWAQKVKKKQGLKAAFGGSTQGGSTTTTATATTNEGSSTLRGIQMGGISAPPPAQQPSNGS